MKTMPRNDGVFALRMAVQGEATRAGVEDHVRLPQRAVAHDIRGVARRLTVNVMTRTCKRGVQ